MSNSIKTLKRYCKATLSMIFNKKNFDDFKKKTISRIVFLSQSKILLLNM